MFNEDNVFVTDEEALVIFGEEYGRVGHFEKAKAKELEYYSRTHSEFDRELVNMTTVLFIISSGKKPYEFTETDIKLIKWGDRHNLRNGKGPISRANNKLRKKFPMEDLQKWAIAIGAFAGSLYILIKMLIRYS